ncbi:MAG: universal stress protein [Haloarculaceae archaeon]
MRFLVATDSVHTTASACDYLGERAGPDDEVLVLTVDGEGEHRDGTDALNVASVRLVEPAVETLRREGVPADEILAVADEREVDEVVMGARQGSPGAETPVGGTTRQVLAAAAVPVVVVPLADLN